MFDKSTELSYCSDNINSFNTNSFNTTVYIESREYKDLIESIDTYEKLLSKTTDEVERIEISEKLNKKKEELEQFKQNVIRLAETFTKIEINTERLKQAKEYFEKGEFEKARAVLDDELLQQDQKRLLNEKEKLAKTQAENEQQLRHNADEYLVKAELEALNYENPNWFEAAKTYYECSLQSNVNENNLFSYALFLQSHSQFAEALLYYEKYLSLYNDNLPNVATTLNNLGNLYSDLNNYPQAKEAYNEALEIRRTLARANPQAYLPDVAMTLNNLGILYSNLNNYPKAKKAYNEALKTYRTLAEANPQAYLPYVATTLNNLGNLYSNLNNYPQAEEAYNEALEIRRTLAQANPQAYLPYVATTLNNLGNLYSNLNNYPQAEEAFNDALEIRRALAENNPRAFILDIAVILNNLGTLYSNFGNYSQAEEAYKEALGIYITLAAENNPQAYLPYVITTLVNIGILHFNKENKNLSLQFIDEAIVICHQVNRTPHILDLLNTCYKILKAWEITNIDEYVKKLLAAKK